MESSGKCIQLILFVFNITDVETLDANQAAATIESDYNFAEEKNS